MPKLQAYQGQVPTLNQVIQALRRFQREHGLTTCLPNVTSRTRQEGYRLEPELITPLLQAEMDTLCDWMLVPDPQHQELQILLTEEIALNRLDVTYRMLGWLEKVKRVPAHTLSLTQLVVFTPLKSARAVATTYEQEQQITRKAQQSAEQTLTVVWEILHWLKVERQVNPRTLKFVLEVIIEIAKLLYRDETDRFKGKPYTDIPVLVLLRQMRQNLKKEAAAAPPVADLALKWLDWDAFVRFVRQLELECRPQYNSQKVRSPHAIGRSVRRYLICALLCYMPPDRQRTLRQLVVGKTLLKGVFRSDGFFQAADDGQWYIWLGQGDYKTAKTCGDSMRQIPALLVPYLEDWLTKWRAVFHPTHDYVFTQENGKPYTKASNFSGIIRHAAHRLTGQLLHSHLIRHMLVTHLKRLKIAPDLQQNVALAMRHSTEAQPDYDQRSLLEQVLPAQELMLQLAQGQIPDATAKVLSPQELLTLLRQLPKPDFERLMVQLGR